MCRAVFQQALTNAHEGWPLIFYAVQTSNYNVFAHLLEAGTPVDIISPPGLHLLAFVVLCPNNTKPLEMVKLLLQKGADPSALPIEAFRNTGGPCWGALREKAATIDNDLPAWWTVAPENWLRNLRARLTLAIR